MGSLIYTKEQDQIIRDCAADGLSYSDVGERIGKNRNQVAGRAHRLGVAFRCSPERVSEINRANQIKRWAKR